MRHLPLEALHRQAQAQLSHAVPSALANAPVFDFQSVVSYGEPGKLSLLARAGAGLLDLSHRGRLAVIGPDRASWLQGLVTNDLAKLSVGGGCAAAALTNKGKLVGDLRVYLRPDEIWIDVDGTRRAAVLEHLSHFIVMEDCEVVDRSESLAVLALVGPHAAAVARSVFPALPPLSAPPALDDHAQVDVEALGHQVVAVGWPELGLPGIALWLSPEAAAPLWGALRAAGAIPLGFDAAEVLRIEAGRPREGAELDENVIPLEALLEGAISDSKGCYLGQEVIARITHRGHVNRKLSGFKLSGVASALPAALTHDGKVVGELRSAVQSPSLAQAIGLGYLRRELLAPGTVVSLPDGSSATLSPLPFV